MRPELLKPAWAAATTAIVVSAMVVLRLAAPASAPATVFAVDAGLQEEDVLTEPSDCIAVDPSQDLQVAIDAAPSGAALCLAPGNYNGTFHIDRSLTLWGPSEAVLTNPTRGSTLFIDADDVRLAGFTISGSGTRYHELDSGIFVQRAAGVRIDGLRLDNVLFGVTAHQAEDLVLSNTEIICRPQRGLGLRGDGVRFWETRRSVVSHNRVQRCRDMVMWYSPDNLIESNHFEEGRYGTHFMYSSGNLVRGNVFTDNVVGIFVMYSANVRIDNNVLAASSGAAGVGLGFKEAGNVEVVRNLIIDNTTGVYVDTSPLYIDHSNLFTLNDFRFNDVALTFHASPRDTALVANTFARNSRQLAVRGGGDATGINWIHNYFDTYQGYDMVGDGWGDIPHEMRSTSEQLIGNYPDVEFFTNTPVLFLIETASRIAPLYQPQLLMRDEQPLIQPVAHSDGAPDFDTVLEEHGLLTIIEDNGKVRVELRTDDPDSSSSD